MSSARIVIITNGPLARNPRVHKEASTLGSAGYDVVVIFLRNHAASEVHDLALLANVPYRRVPVDLLPGYDTPTWQVNLRRACPWLGRKLMSSLRCENMHALGPASLLLKIARHIPADLYVVHNEVPHWVGLQLLAKGHRVAADIEDWHTEDLLPEARRHRPLRLIRKNEAALLHRAAYTTTTSHALAATLHARYGGQLPEVITNSFPLHAEIRRYVDGSPQLLWFSQTIGPGRGLESFIEAWGRTRAPSQLTLVGEDAGGFTTTLRRLLPDSRQKDFKTHPLVSPTELPGLIARFDIGLALEPTSPLSRDLTITNKILQYLNAGLAVIASETSGQREVLAREPLAGVLFSFDDPAGLTQRIESLLDNPQNLVLRQAAARKLAETHYCWERESARLVKIVVTALARTTPRPGC